MGLWTDSTGNCTQIYGSPDSFFEPTYTRRLCGRTSIINKQKQYGNFSILRQYYEESCLTYEIKFKVECGGTGSVRVYFPGGAGDDGCGINFFADGHAECNIFKVGTFSFEFKKGVVNTFSANATYSGYTRFYDFYLNGIRIFNGIAFNASAKYARGIQFDFNGVTNNKCYVFDEIRVSSARRYSGSSYVVSEEPLEVDDNTLMLFHFDSDPLTYSTIDYLKSTPLYPCNITAELYAEITDRYDGKISVFDYGEAHDKYSSDWSVYGTVAECEAVIEEMRVATEHVICSNEGLKYQGPQFQYSVYADYNYDPFAVVDFSESPKIGTTHSKVSIQAAGLIPHTGKAAQTTPGACSVGPFVIDSQPMPSPTLTPNLGYSPRGVNTSGPNWYSSQKSQSMEQVRTTIKWTALNDEQCAFLQYLLTTKYRYTPIPFSCSDKEVFFGAGFSATSGAMQLCTNTLKMVQRDWNLWEIEFTVLLYTEA